MQLMAKFFEKNGLEDAFPWLAKIAPRLCGIENKRRHANGMKNMVKQEIDEHKRSFVEGAEPKVS